VADACSGSGSSCAGGPRLELKCDIELQRLPARTHREPAHLELIREGSMRRPTGSLSQMPTRMSSRSASKHAHNTPHLASNVPPHAALQVSAQRSGRPQDSTGCSGLCGAMRPQGDSAASLQPSWQHRCLYFNLGLHLRVSSRLPDIVLALPTLVQWTWAVSSQPAWASEAHLRVLRSSLKSAATILHIVLLL
jgi:hypothetical protein